jgi:hypothetical protein
MFIVESLNRLLRLIGSLIFLAVAGPVCASLGDNGDRVDDSYGKVVEHRLRDDGTVSVLYHKDRYFYFVVFDKNQSVLEKYSRVDGRDLSPKEISSFLKANAGHATWKRADQASEQRYERSDGKAEAKYGRVDGRPTLTVGALTRQRAGVKGD